MMKPKSPLICWLRGLSLAMILLVCASAGAREIRVNQTEHPLDAYAVGAIRVALKGMEGYTLKVTTDQNTQARAIEYLETGDMDLMWLASNQTVESQLLPIRFPLLKGLLGHRVFIINPLQQSRLAQVGTFDDLRKLSFGQGAGCRMLKSCKATAFRSLPPVSTITCFIWLKEGDSTDFPGECLNPGLSWPPGANWGSLWKTT